MMADSVITRSDTAAAISAAAFPAAPSVAAVGRLRHLHEVGHRRRRHRRRRLLPPCRSPPPPPPFLEEGVCAQRTWNTDTSDRSPVDPPELLEKRRNQTLSHGRARGVFLRLLCKRAHTHIHLSWIPEGQSIFQIKSRLMVACKRSRGGVVGLPGATRGAAPETGRRLTKDRVAELFAERVSNRRTAGPPLIDPA